MQGSRFGNKRKIFPAVLPNVIMVRQIWSEEQLFVRGQPEEGAELANDLQCEVDIYDGQTIAACAASLAALSEYLLDAVYSLKDHPNIMDIRSIGSIAGVELASNGKPA